MRFAHQEIEESAQLSDWANQAGWNVWYDQAEAGAFHAVCDMAAATDLKIHLEQFTLATRIHGTAPAGWYVLTLPENGAHFRGHEVRGSILCLTAPGDPLLCRTPSRHRCDTFLIRADLLKRMLQEQTPERAVSLPSSSMLRFDTTQRQMLRLLAREIVRLAAQENGTTTDPHFVEAKLAFTKQLAATLQQTLLEAPVPHDDREVRHVACVCHFIRQNLHHPLCLEEMCEHAGIRPRTLQTRFRHVMGVSPIRFARECRLNAIHLHLRRASGVESQVKAIAIDYGFFHSGHFWQDYVELFGECPSETLARD